MKAILAFYLASFVNCINADPFEELRKDNAPGKIHSLYAKHYTAYKKYLKAFNKKHDPSVPEPIRLLKFAQASKMIEEHNARYKKGLVTFRLGLNEMSDWTEEEKSRIRGAEGQDIPSETVKPINLLINVTRRRLTKFDYRKKLSLKIKRQGTCGVCYICAALSALEIYRAIRSKKKSVEELSVQDILDCAGFSTCYPGGGQSTDVFGWIAKNGVMREKDLPYKAGDSQCPRKPNRIKNIVKGGAIVSGGEDGIRYLLANYGPVIIHLHTKTELFQYYSNGIYDEPACEDPNLNLDHAVVVVGYGEEKGQKYFIFQNSWGKTWGENGFGRIAADKAMCGLGKYLAIPMFN